MHLDARPTDIRAPRHVLALLLVLLVAALVVAGCGADDGGSKKSSDSSDAKKSTSDDDGGDSGDRGGSDEEFSKLVKAQKSAKYKITYEVTAGSTTDGEEDATTTAMTFAVDGERTAITVDGTTMIQTPDDGFVMCTSTGGEEPSCIGMGDTGEDASSAQLGAIAGQFALATEFSEDQEGVERDDDREIAGRDASCWKYEAAFLGTGTHVVSCLDKESGAPLLVEWGAKAGGDTGTYRSEAKSYDDVTDADFEPPAEVTDLGAMQEQLEGMEGKSPEEQAKMAEEMAAAMGSAGGTTTPGDTAPTP